MQTQQENNPETALLYISVSDTSSDEQLLLKAPPDLKLTQIHYRLQNRWKNKKIQFLKKGKVFLWDEDQNLLRDVLEKSEEGFCLKVRTEHVKRDYEAQLKGKIQKAIWKEQNAINILLDAIKLLKNQEKSFQAKKSDILKKVQEKLVVIGYELDLEDQLSYDDVLNSLNNKLLQSHQCTQQLQKQLQNIPLSNLSNLKLNFKSQVCTAFLNNSKTKNCAVDLENTKHSQEDQQNVYRNSSQSYEVGSEAQKNRNSDHSMSLKGSLDIGGKLNLGGLKVQGGYDAQGKDSQSSKAKGKQIVSCYNQTYIGEGILIESTSIKLKKSYIQTYHRFFKGFTDGKGDDIGFRGQIKKWINENGYEIEYGNYYFGAQYEVKSLFEWKKDQISEKEASLSNKELKAALSGDNKLLKYVINAKLTGELNSKGTKNISNQVNNQKQFISREFKCRPPVRQIQEWRSSAPLCKNQWKIVQKDTKMAKLHELVQHKINLPKQLDGMYDKIYNFNQLIQSLYDEMYPKITQSKIKKAKSHMEISRIRPKRTYDPQLIQQFYRKNFKYFRIGHKNYLISRNQLKTRIIISFGQLLPPLLLGYEIYKGVQFICDKFRQNIVKEADEDFFRFQRFFQDLDYSISGKSLSGFMPVETKHGKCYYTLINQETTLGVVNSLKHSERISFVFQANDGLFQLTKGIKQEVRIRFDTIDKYLEFRQGVFCICEQQSEDGIFTIETAKSNKQ